jgi:glycosyltransferase involved in cell wall biosynthesis
MNASAKVTIVIPTMNEVEGMKWFMPRLERSWYDQLIVVDGGSTDGTLEYCKEHGHEVVMQTRGVKGVSRALVDAFKRVENDIVLTISPDGNSLPEHIPKLIAKIREGYDMVVVSRYFGGAVSYDDDRFTRLGNRAFTKIINVLFDAQFTDTLVIFRAYTRDAIIRMRLDEQPVPNWFRRNLFDLESWDLGSCMRAAKLGLKVTEIPGDEPKRIGGVRKLSIVRHGTGALLQVGYEFITGRDF